MSKSTKAHLSYDELIQDGNASSVDGWDFSWFEGRATEERPSWGYAKTMSDRMGKATAALDIQTGGGEVLAKVEKFPTLIAATESWPPNVAIATRLLGTRGVVVVVDEDEPPLPFGDEAFDLVVSRHPVKGMLQCYKITSIPVHSTNCVQLITWCLLFKSALARYLTSSATRWYLLCATRWPS